MGMKLRINVVSPSRNKRFLVLAEREWTIDILRRCTENVFQRLYPREPKMYICAIQNEFHSDIPLDYHVEDVLTDAGLIFVVEEEANSNPLASSSMMTSLVKNSSDEEDRHGIPRKRKSKKKTQKSKQHQLEQVDETSSDRVTSTTSPVLVEEGKGSNLTPQLVEKICEDPEVDIETIEDESEQNNINSCEGTELPTGTDDTESRIIEK